MKKFLLGVAALLAFASCQNEKEEIKQDLDGEKEIIDLGKVENDSTDEVIALIEAPALANGLKATSSSYLYDLKVISANTANLDSYYLFDNNIYYRYTIDLNEGAGGSYIYLCAAFTNDRSKAITHMRGLAYNKAKSPEGMINGYKPVTDFNGRWVDLNEGAGGAYIYLSQSKQQDATPYASLLVTSSNKSKSGTYSYGGKTWYPLVSDQVNGTIDLNMSTKKHNRYVYIWYLRG